MKTLLKISEKFQAINYNQDNYHVGGGLYGSGKFASNRHEDANNDPGKLTLGETCQMFKKATKLETDYIKEIIEFKYRDLEWHHAGKLPKQYGGGMKKTYFVNSEQIVFLSKNFDAIVCEFEQAKVLAQNKKEQEAKKEAAKLDFLNRYAKRFIRVSSTPSHGHYFTTDSEMDGKYGWFPANHKYNMTVYYSGWEFDDEETYQKYLDFDRTEKEKGRIKLRQNGLDSNIANFLEKTEGYSIEKVLENKDAVCDLVAKLISLPSPDLVFSPDFKRRPDEFLTENEQNARAAYHAFISSQGEAFGSSYERRLAHEAHDEKYHTLAMDRFDADKAKWLASDEVENQRIKFVKDQAVYAKLFKKLTKLVK
jgi:hypothetical protein